MKKETFGSVGFKVCVHDGPPLCVCVINSSKYLAAHAHSSVRKPVTEVSKHCSSIDATTTTKV